MSREDQVKSVRLLASWPWKFCGINPAVVTGPPSFTGRSRRSIPLWDARRHHRGRRKVGWSSCCSHSGRCHLRPACVTARHCRDDRLKASYLPLFQPYSLLWRCCLCGPPNGVRSSHKWHLPVPSDKSKLELFLVRDFLKNRI